MENIDIQETIDLKYIIIDKKGDGASSNVYVVKDTTDQTIYAAKVLKKPSHLYKNEISILKEIKNLNNPYIINYICNGDGIVFHNKKEKIRSYLILENAEKGTIFNYIFCHKSGLKERYSKLIFSKILKGIQACHNAGICHRDIKLENILLDKNYSPKICDFGFATHNNFHLEERLGTSYYIAPEIYNHESYDGFKYDIFSLGVVLLNLSTNKFGFLKAIKEDYYYNNIINNNIEGYWNSVSGQIPVSNMSPEFKKLYIKMISYNPKDRPSVEEILNGEWMKEIRDMSKEQLEKLENEVRKEFMKREKSINETLIKETEVENENSEESGGNRVTDDNNDFFGLDLKLSYAQTGLNMDNYIKLKGNNINPGIFMNSLCKKIKKEFEANCKIKPNNDKNKFLAIFTKDKSDFEEDEINEDIIEEDNQIDLDEDKENLKNENIKGNQLIIKVKMYESYNGGYLLKFVKKEGTLYEYLDKLEKIYSLINSKNK